MTGGSVSLCVDDAVELGELLEFVGRWLVSDDEVLSASLARFVGACGYDLEELRADVVRFAVLLGGDDSSVVLGARRR